LKQKFKGTINPTAIWWCCPEKWKSPGRVSAGRKGGLNSRGLSKGLENPSLEEEPLTEYEQQFAQKHIGTQSFPHPAFS
jgi:hypothetical protein